MLKLVSDRPGRDTLPEAWLRAVVQWQVVWLRSYATGYNALADLVSAELDRIRP
jgi:hypothetical protein